MPEEFLEMRTITLHLLDNKDVNPAEELPQGQLLLCSHLRGSERARE